MTKPKWTDEMVEMFGLLFYTHSYSQIGRAMTKKFGREFTPSAIAGHAHRNGFGKPRKPAKVKPPKPERKKPLKVRPQPIEEAGDDAPFALDFTPMTNPCWNGTRDKSVSLLELNDDSCRFPQDVDGEARWCGATAIGVYCARHARISYRPPNARKAPQRPYGR